MPLEASARKIDNISTTREVAQSQLYVLFASIVLAAKNDENVAEPLLHGVDRREVHAVRKYCSFPGTNTSYNAPSEYLSYRTLPKVSP